MKYLVLLPCNRYAIEGNYFKGRYWKIADKLRRNAKNDITLGAIDCIPVFYLNINDAIVLENEMHIVKGYDSYPRYSKGKIKPLAEGIKNGLIRVANQFDRIIVLLNVKLYMEALQEAMKELPESIKRKIEVRYVNGFPGKFIKMIKETISSL